MAAQVRRCLCIIDVQNDFVLPTGGLSVPNGREIIPVINHVRRTKQFDLVVQCMDWHPYNHFFATGSPGYAPFAQLGPQTIWPDHCYQDSEGAAVHPDLHVEHTDVVVRCGLSPLTDSYSAFRDNDRSTVSPLLEVSCQRAVPVGILATTCPPPPSSRCWLANSITSTSLVDWIVTL